jgi:hypothetical protein
LSQHWKKGFRFFETASKNTYGSGGCVFSCVSRFGPANGIGAKPPERLNEGFEDISEEVFDL